jgi:hypothetical protein
VIPASPLPPSLPPSPWENRRLCQLVLEKGIDAMPEPDHTPGRGNPLPPRRDSYRDLLNELINDSSI